MFLRCSQQDVVICWWTSSIFEHLVKKKGLSKRTFYLMKQKKTKNQLSQFSESSLFVATSNKLYFEENTMCEWFEVIVSQKRYRCIASQLRARQNGTIVCYM